MKTIKLVTFLFLSGLALTGCSNDDDKDIPKEINPDEVITTMNVTLTAPSGDVVTFKSFDKDGNGPNAPQITVSGPLMANTIYSGTMEMLNEQANPTENTTEEIMSEANAHQFFFLSQGGLNAETVYADNESDYVDKDDEKGGKFTTKNPVGIKFTLSTGEASTGMEYIVLRHQPNKPNDGTLKGAAGETDFEATFPVTIQ